MIDIQDSWYRVSAKALILDNDGRFFLCKEEDGNWDFPGGGVEHGEDPRVSVLRELEEELGVKGKLLDPKPYAFIVSEKPNSKRVPWLANVFYLIDIDVNKIRFSNECIEYGFFNTLDAKNLKILPNVEAYISEVEGNR